MIPRKGFQRFSYTEHRGNSRTASSLHGEEVRRLETGWVESVRRGSADASAYSEQGLQGHWTCTCSVRVRAGCRHWRGQQSGPADALLGGGPRNASPQMCLVLGVPCTLGRHLLPGQATAAPGAHRLPSCPLLWPWGTGTTCSPKPPCGQPHDLGRPDPGAPDLEVSPPSVSAPR